MKLPVVFLVGMAVMVSFGLVARLVSSEWAFVLGALAGVAVTLLGVGQRMKIAFRRGRILNRELFK